MAMSGEQFEALILKFHEQSIANPAAYHKKASRFMLLGPLYVYGILSLSLTVTLGLGYWMALGHATENAIKIEFVSALLTGLLLFTTYVPEKAPRGRMISRENAPRLWSLLENITKDIRCAPITGVYLTYDFQSSAIQRSRFGIFGGVENYVSIGLPMLIALSAEQMTAVIGHEMGHLSRKDALSAARMNRQAAVWRNLLQTFNSNSVGGHLAFGQFFNWYKPIVDAHMLVLGRQQEFIADSYAAGLTSRETAAKTLIRTACLEPYLSDKFWEGVYKGADREAEPNARPYASMREACGIFCESPEARDILHRAMITATRTMDWEPSLTDRLYALGSTLPQLSHEVVANLALPPDSKITAGQYFLDRYFSEVIDEVDREWAESVEDTWATRYESVQTSKGRIVELEAKETANVELTKAEKRAKLDGYYLFEPDKVLPLLREMLAEFSDDPSLKFALGRDLIQAKDSQGVKLLEEAMASDSRLALEGATILCTYFEDIGDAETEEYWRKRQRELWQLEQRHKKETDFVWKSDAFIQAELSDELRNEMIEKLRAHPNVKAAWIFRKPLSAFPEREVTMLYWIPKSSWRQWYVRLRFINDSNYLAEHLGFTGQRLVICRNWHNQWMLARVKALQGSRLI